MRRQWLRPALKGAGIAVGLVALIGAVYGAIAGVQLFVEDGRPYHRPTGLDGAVLGAVIAVVVGGLPAAAVGGVAGVLLGRPRDRGIAS
jgi:hypothetical protein